MNNWMDEWRNENWIKEWIKESVSWLTDDIVVWKSVEAKDGKMQRKSANFFRWDAVKTESFVVNGVSCPFQYASFHLKKERKMPKLAISLHISESDNGDEKNVTGPLNLSGPCNEEKKEQKIKKKKNK